MLAWVAGRLSQDLISKSGLSTVWSPCGHHVGFLGTGFFLKDFSHFPSEMALTPNQTGGVGVG
jgi:hypothetical protein